MTTTTNEEFEFDDNRPEERLQIPMTISPAEIGIPFLIELQNIYWRVALGLNCVETATNDSLHLPAEFSFKPAADVPESLENSKTDFQKWIITNGLRDCAEAFHALLEITYGQCLLLKCAAETGKISSEIYEGEYASKRKAFHKFDIRKRLQTLLNEFNISFRDDTMRCFRSLNRVRNCLAHRGGFVQRVDCNNGDYLKVEWLTLVPIKPDGTEIEFGKPLGATEILAQKRVRSRVFQQQTYIDFSGRDFAEFLMSYTFLAYENTENVLAYAKSVGLREAEIADS